MSISPARTAAFDILLRIEQQDAYASELLHSGPHAKLSPANHAAAVDLARIPERIRGYGHVKEANLAAAKRDETQLLAAFRDPAPARVAAE